MGSCVFGWKWWPTHLLFWVNSRSSSTLKGLPLHTALRSSQHSLIPSASSPPPRNTPRIYLLLLKPWHWRELLRVPWTTRRSNQSILKGINLEYSLGGLMLKLKLQYFGPLMQRADSLGKTLMLGKTEGRRRRGRQRMRWLDGITDSMDMSPGVGDGQGSLACCGPWGRKESDTTERLNWTELSSPLLLPSVFPSIRVFSNRSILRIRWPKDSSFSFSISPSNAYSRLTSFRIDLFDLLVSKGITRVFSNTTVQKHHFFRTQLYSPSLTSVHDH